MKRFVVCDDDRENAAAVGGLLSSIYGETGAVKYIRTGEALAELLMSDSDTDVLLLDIELGPVNSIELVKEHLRGSSALQIVYISGFVHYCTDVYDTRHISFLSKPVDKAKLQKAVDSALAAGRALRESGISVQEGSVVHIIPTHSLIYTESLARCLHLVTDDEELDVYEKTSDLAKRLPVAFLQCHKSFIVNLQRVKKFRGDTFLMDNGQSVPISQSRRKAVREAFLRYLEGASWNQK